MVVQLLRNIIGASQGTGGGHSCVIVVQLLGPSLQGHRWKGRYSMSVTLLLHPCLSITTVGMIFVSWHYYRAGVIMDLPKSL